MSIPSVVKAVDITCTIGQAFSGAIPTDITIGDAERLSMSIDVAPGGFAFIEVSDNFDLNYQLSGLTIVQAAAAATWRTLQRVPEGGGALAEVSIPATALVSNEYESFICKAFRFRGGNATVPANFVANFVVTIMKKCLT